MQRRKTWICGQVTVIVKDSWTPQALRRCLARSSTRRSAGAPLLPFSVHLHAAVFTSWLVLFVVQTSLVRHGRVDPHRQLGAAGAVLAATMLIVGLALTIGFPQVIGGIILLFVLSGPVYDWVRYRRVYAVYVWGGILTMLTLPPRVGSYCGDPRLARCRGLVVREPVIRSSR